MTGEAYVLREWFGVSPAAGRVAAALYTAGGAMVSHADLCAVALQTANGLNLSIKRLRAAMEPDSIKNVPCRGFVMTQAGLADCRAALDDAERRGVAA